MNEAALKAALEPHEFGKLQVPPPGVRPSPDDMLTMTELAARLKQAMRTVERWHQNGVVLGIKVDGVVIFYWPSVVARLVEKYQEREKAPPKPVSNDPCQMTKTRREGKPLKR